MTIRITLIALALTLGVSCKKSQPSSKDKSFVGLNAELDASILRGEAPSFLLLQQWFNRELPLDLDKAQEGGVTYRVHSEFSGATLDRLPTEYKTRLLAYLDQQQVRVNEFQSNLSRPEKLKDLLKLEVDEMADILRALIDPNYVPKTNDLLAQLISHKPIRNFIDRYSVELLEKLYARSQRSLILGMDKERDNFKDLLVKAYVTKVGATEKLKISLEENCAKLGSIIRAMTGSVTHKCTSASQYGLTSGFSLPSSADGLTGAPGKVLGVFGSLSSPGGFASSGVSPRLRIFSGRDPNANDPYNPNSTQVAPDTSVNPSKSKLSDSPQSNAPVDDMSTDSTNSNHGSNSVNLIGLLAQLLFGLPGNSGLGLTEEVASEEGFSLTLPPKPRGICSGKSGLQLVICQRYIETLPSSSVLLGNSGKSGGSFKLDSNDLSLSTNGPGYNFYLVSKYATRVQNQGSEGACTAFGMAHTLGILGKIKGKSGEYNAWNIWRTQGQQMYTQASISAAKRMSFDGLKISSVRNVAPSVSGLKRTLDAGRPIYFASDVDNSWNGANRGNASITCRGSRGIGHAYVLVGYDDSSQNFIIKNSWGDYWGDQGYGYLPYRCIGRMNEDAYDIQLN
jgi:hypothetical protein